MGYDEREAGNPFLSIICGKKVVDGLENGLTLDSIVEFAEEGDGFLSARLADTVVGVEEEVVTGIGWRCDGRVEDGEVADAWEDEVLEDGCRCG